MLLIFLEKNKKIFSQINLVSDENLYWPELGLTIDQEEDFQLIKKIIQFFGKKNIYFECKDIVSLLKKKKKWSEINKKVKRIGSLMTG